MQWGFVVALVLAIPLILFPAAFVWYLNIGGIYAAIKKTLGKGLGRRQKSSSESYCPPQKKDGKFC